VLGQHLLAVERHLSGAGGTENIINFWAATDTKENKFKTP
jgi:hypothetical protein